MYKPYKLNPIWESVLILGVVAFTWGLLNAIGVVAWLRWIVFAGQAVTLMILLEVILPRYRFYHASRQLKENPGSIPKAKGIREGLAEVIAEGPGMDPVIGRKGQYSNHRGDTEPLPIRSHFSDEELDQGPPESKKLRRL